MTIRVLIVDDAAFMRKTIKDLLKDNPEFEVVGEAENGLLAIERYKELKPDVVTMDITMQELDGIGAVKEIMKIDPSAKIVMCTAMGQHTMVMDALTAGAKDFIVKPLKKDRVIEALIKATS